MATILLPPDFREFLKLLKSYKVEYLLIGGYAVGYYGYPRATADMDLWIAVHNKNAEEMVAVLKEFGFDVPELSKDIFLKENQILRLGRAPIRIEIFTSIYGVCFQECYSERTIDVIDDVEVSIISLKHLKLSKQASGRHRDMDDLEHL